MNAVIANKEDKRSKYTMEWFKARQKQRGLPNSQLLTHIVNHDFSIPSQPSSPWRAMGLFDLQDGGGFQSDYANYMKPSDDLYSGTTTGGDYDGVFTLWDLQYLADRRLGVANNITWGAERNATRNWFQFAEPDNLKPFKNETTKDVYKLMVKTDFKRQSYPWGAHERQFGVSYLFLDYGQQGDLSTPAPNKPPVRFEAISPLHLSPTNTFQTRGISWDPEVWEFNNGHLGTINGKGVKLHKSRIKVMLTRPNANDWRGLSVMDPCALSMSCYLNAMVFLLRAFAKFGNMAAVWKTASEHPETYEILERMDLLEEFQMNGNFVVGKNDQIEFPNTRIAAGLYEAMEIYKEDIASSVQIPINHLFMRNVGGGLSDGDLTAERTYLNTLANIQMDRTDDYLDIWHRWYPELEDKTLLWNIAIQRTRAQEINIEQMEIQTKILAEQLKQQRFASKQAKMNQEMMEMQMEILKSGNMMSPEETETVETAETIEDFAPPQINARLMADYYRLATQNAKILDKPLVQLSPKK